MRVYAKATDNAKRRAVEALPFAEVTEPAPRLRVVGNNGIKSALDNAQDFDTSPKPLKIKAQTA